MLSTDAGVREGRPCTNSITSLGKVGSSTISVDHLVIHSSNLRYGTLAFFSSP